MSLREYFWGTELNDKKKEIVWDPDQDEDDDDMDSSGITHFLFLKQAVLGVKAKENERNVVEVQAEDFDGNSVKQPLFSLKMGLNESVILDIGAQPPLTLRLISGSGPVYLSGQHALEVTEDDLDMLDDEAEESPVKLSPVAQAKKRSASASGGPAKKVKLDDTSNSKTKPGQKVAEDAEEDDSDSEGDEDFDVNMGDESDKEDSDDEEDEDDSDEDDAEEDTKTPPPQKKGSKVNGAGPKGDAKQEKAKDKKPLSVEQIKKLLSESPSKPKKQVKFLNVIKNTYKINDKEVVQELWSWYKDSVLKGQK